MTLKDVKGWNAVHFAAKVGSADALEALSAFKADFNGLNSDGQNPFHVACQNGKGKIVKYLVQRGANPKLKDKKGATARAMCSKKTLKDVKKAERVWSKRLDENRVVFRDWLHTFELEIQGWSGKFCLRICTTLHFFLILKFLYRKFRHLSI